VSENVTYLPKTDSCDSNVLFHSMLLLSELDSAVPIRSDQIDQDGPPAFTRGVRWDPCTPAGYKTLTAHNADGVLVLKHMVREDLVDDGLVDRGWAWLDRQCPEMSSGAAIAEPQLPALRLLA
jgi:hypothetical protein